MRIPGFQFFKRVLGIQQKNEKPINKPEDQKKIEKTSIIIPRHFSKIYHPAPYFESRALAKLRAKRKIHNRIQKTSRKINAGLI